MGSSRYEQVKLDRFSGLDLVDDASEIGWGRAVDILNVDFDKHGRLRSRDGSLKFNTVAAANSYSTICPFYASTASTRQLLAARITQTTGGVDVLSTAGAVVTTQAGSAGIPMWFARFGSPGSERVYVTAGNTGGLVYYNGSVFTASAAPVPSIFPCVTPWGDNRLVALNAASATWATASESKVVFSDAGAPETWGASNFVRLTPGDGEKFCGIVAWRDLLFVFKESKFFVFYGASTDSSGNPIFNYRTINVGIGSIPGTTGVPITVGADGVYFVSRRGIYRTTGGEPQLISSPLDAFFLGALDPYFSTGAFDMTSQGIALFWFKERLYANLQALSGSPLFVYDRGADAWTMFTFSVAVNGFGSFRPAGADDELFFSSNSDIYRHSSAYTTDNGSAITSRYRSGFQSVPSGNRADSKRVIRQWHPRGSGTVSFGVAADDATAIPSTGGGASTSISLTGARPNYRVSQIGRNFSWQMSSTGVWRLDSLQADLA